MKLNIKELYLKEKFEGEGNDIKDNYHSMSELKRIVGNLNCIVMVLCLIIILL